MREIVDEHLEPARSRSGAKSAAAGHSRDLLDLNHRMPGYGFYHLRRDLKYIRNAIEIEFMNKTMAIKSKATP